MMWDVGLEVQVYMPVLCQQKKKYFIRIRLTTNNGEISVLIRLFASYQTPEYLVIVGKREVVRALK